MIQLRSVGDWGSDMPGFIDHDLLWVTRCLSHVFLLHLLVFQFIALTLSQGPFMFWVGLLRKAIGLGLT